MVKITRDLIAESVEARFCAAGLPHSLQWLADNGSIYTSNKTRKFAADAGFDVCTTPAYSPRATGWQSHSSKLSNATTFRFTILRHPRR